MSDEGWPRMNLPFTKEFEIVLRTLLAFSILALATPAWSQSEINFNRDIRRILSDRCFQCHGPDESQRQADLRLDIADREGGAYSVIEQGSADNSELWHRIVTDDEDLVMPPAEANKKPLTSAEKATLKRWIEEGAAYADFWAFVPPQMPNLEIDAKLNGSTQPIDQLIMSQLQKQGLTPQPRADRRTLIRRLSLDLTGLPPTPAEIHSFLNDESPEAYSNLVDRLLAKPQYGEHMTKYWLDLVRFADTNGIHHDHFRDMTPYRDWVIRAFNENLPYDDFVAYQIAGDLFESPTQDQLIASGFNRLHLIIDVGTALPEESYTRNVIDRVTAVGTAFMGLTVQCAVCHDHKYDPVTMKDFYQLFAFFNNLDAAPETGGRGGLDFEKGLQPPYISLADETQQKEWDALQANLAAMKTEVADTQAQLEKASEEQDKEELEGKLKAQQEALKTTEEQLKSLQRSIRYAMVMKEKSDPRPAFMLIRGAYDNPGEQVQRNTPAFLPPLPELDHTPTRMDLARWLTQPENPLTARVAVNRFWQQLFGVGIVKTSEDFGAQGEWPSHPELLDYLTVKWLNSGWNVKALLKEIVMSQTYQQSSQASQDAYQKDPENRWLSRGSRYRLDSEVVRDQILATSGLLNPEQYGPSVKPPQPEGLWKSVSLPSSYPRVYQADEGSKVYRRSVYTFWKRGMPPPQMTILNAPTRESCIARRERTNTPLQALLLLNEQQFLNASRHLAFQSLSGEPQEDARRLNVLFETITGRKPDDQEAQQLLQLVNDLRESYLEGSLMAQQLCTGLDLPDSLSPAEVAAWTVLVSTVYNLDETKTRH
jgi:hypothetical protein